jgi:hypothetical protein
LPCQVEIGLGRLALLLDESMKKDHYELPFVFLFFSFVTLRVESLALLCVLCVLCGKNTLSAKHDGEDVIPSNN